MTQVSKPRTSPVMLRTPGEFAAFGAGARQRGDALLSVRARTTTLPITRFGLATGKNVGDAVTRNRTRRRLRAILRALGPQLRSGQDVLIVVRPAGGAASSAQLGDSLTRLLRGLGALA
jgi:ribonuclease P protein component